MSNPKELKQITFLEEERLAYTGRNFYCDEVVYYYDDNDILTPAEKQEFEQHLAGCFTCQQQLETNRRNLNRVRKAFGIKPKTHQSNF